MSSIEKVTEKVKKLPQSPGVYIFYGKNGGQFVQGIFRNAQILYVGKATNLRSRVSSYFRGGESERLIGKFIDEISDIETKETDSVLEALILESHLIKKLQPKYNVMGKDDKSFSYFIITKEEYPRVIILRETDLDAYRKTHIAKRISQNDPRSTINFARIYGPYTSKKQMEIALKIMRKIFPFHSLEQKTEKGCLDFQLGRCPGPYAGMISKKDYAKNIRGIKMILEGKKRSLVKKLEKEMKDHAKMHEFEKATEIRNKVFALKHIRDIALISSEGSTFGIPKVQPSVRVEAYDISNISGDHAVGSMVVFRNSQSEKSQYRKFKIKTVEGIDDMGAMAEVLSRRFRNDWSMPDLILLDGGQGHLNMGLNVLKAFELNIPMVAVAKGKNRKNLHLRFKTNELNNEIKSILGNKKLLKNIMDEAHRFAIAYHKKLRKNNFLT